MKLLWQDRSGGYARYGPWQFSGRPPLLTINYIFVPSCQFCTSFVTYLTTGRAVIAYFKRLLKWKVDRSSPTWMPGVHNVVVQRSIYDRRDAKPARPRVINTILKSRERIIFNDFDEVQFRNNPIDTFLRYVYSDLSIRIRVQEGTDRLEDDPSKIVFSHRFSKQKLISFPFEFHEINWNRIFYRYDRYRVYHIRHTIVKYNSSLEVPPVRSRVL